MKIIKKGWYCPKCNALISSKRYKAGLITCDCYEKAGANMCLPDSKKDQKEEYLGEEICWYNIIKDTQKRWKEVFIKEENQTSESHRNTK